MPSILFVCSANRYRSPLAAAFFSQCLEKTADAGKYSVSSAGTWAKPGLPPDGRAARDAQEWGLNIKTHRSRQIDAAILSHSDLVLVMEAGQKEALQIEFPRERDKIFMVSEVAEGLSYDIPDPFDPDGPTHQEITSELFALIKRGFDKILTLSDHKSTEARPTS